MKNKFIKSLMIISVLIIALSTPSQAQAIIEISPSQLYFKGTEFEPDTLSDTLIITNGGENPLNWSASWDEPWLHAQPSSGSAPDSVIIKVSAENLAYSHYSEQIIFESPEASNSPLIVDVIFRVQPPCQGKCGDANSDDAVGVSDAIWIINYVFIGGGVPQPVLACGDANGDCYVNISDAVWILRYVFQGGDSPGECCLDNWEGQGGNCCPFF